MESAESVNAVCRETWRRDVAGSCPVHGGASCLVSPSGLLSERDQARAEAAEQARALAAIGEAVGHTTDDATPETTAAATLATVEYLERRLLEVGGEEDAALARAEKAERSLALSLATIDSLAARGWLPPDLAREVTEALEDVCDWIRTDGTIDRPAPQLGAVLAKLRAQAAPRQAAETRGEEETNG